MLFACSGIPLPFDDLTRIVTSACLVREFNIKRNRDDKLRVCAANNCALYFALFTQANCVHFALIADVMLLSL